MNGQKARILIVDPDLRHRRDLSDVLGRSHTCSTCDGAAQAHLRLRRERFDVVVSDADAGVMEGTALVEFVSSLQAGPRVILLSKDPDVAWVRYAFKRGVFDVVPGRSNTDEIRRSVEHAVGHRDMEAPADKEVACHDVAPLDAVRALEQLRMDCRRRDEPMSVLVVDIDGFSRINKSTSRDTGDELLRWFSTMLRRTARDGDVIACRGADRFVLALRDAGENEAMALINQIRREVAEGAPAGLKPRFRAGVAVSQASFTESADDLLERASIAAERAKTLGGNQTVCWSRCSVVETSRRRLERASVDQVSQWIGRSRQQIRQGYLESTQALVAAVEAREPLTREHSRVVSLYCEEIARRMDLPAKQVDILKTAALLHDVGKIGVPDAILQKPAPLTAEEFEVIKQHPQIAVDILSHASFLHNELPLILHHHERFDGRGYPAGLSGEQIPLGARILNVADSLDAMLSARTYKKAFDTEHVRAELKRCSGAQFDEEIADVALEWLEEASHTAAPRLA